MPAFHLALQTRRGAGSDHDVVVGATQASPRPITLPARIVLADQCADPDAFSARYQTAVPSAASPQAVLRALGPEACLSLFLDPADLIVRAGHAVPLHFFRFADATVKPLPPDPAPLVFAAGDAYVALTPGALRLADGPAIARFIHLRDYFNAERFAAALLIHLAEVAGTDAFPEDVTVLVVEAR